jgi:hypothetical protein
MKGDLCGANILTIVFIDNLHYIRRWSKKYSFFECMTTTTYAAGLPIIAIVVVECSFANAIVAIASKTCTRIIR